MTKKVFPVRLAPDKSIEKGCFSLSSLASTVSSMTKYNMTTFKSNATYIYRFRDKNKIGDGIRNRLNFRV